MKTLIFLFTLFVFVIATGVVFAQPPGHPLLPDQAPIDGGLGLLAAAGGAYALKKLKDRTKQTDE